MSMLLKTRAPFRWTWTVACAKGFRLLALVQRCLIMVKR
jgi:hypothetical protein